jgi:hypothetical protein
MVGGIRKNRRMAWHGMAWHGMMIMLSGCAQTVSISDSETEALLRTLQSRVDSADSSSARDFGTILARGQTLRHEFPLRNPSDQSLRILGAEALTPCCSFVEKLPEIVPPRGVIGVPVVFRPGFQGGRKQVRFAVHTESAAQPTRLFTLLVSLVPEVEVEVLEGSDTRLLLGEVGKQSLRVTSQRMGDEGRGAPEVVSAGVGVEVRFIGSTVEHLNSDGLVTTTRIVEVTLLAGSEVGTRAAELAFHWEGGLTHEQRVTWRVARRIEASPAALILNDQSGRVARELRLTSLCGPFRVLAIHGSGVAVSGGLPKESRREHELRFVVEVERVQSEGLTDIVIDTDMVEQPKVVVSLLVLPTAKGAP